MKKELTKLYIDDRKILLQTKTKVSSNRQMKNIHMYKAMPHLDITNRNWQQTEGE